MKIAISLTLLLVAGVGAADAANRAQFCARWHNVCRTTCPAGVPTVTCHAVCADRLDACRKSGCYFFNRPRPRCEGDLR
jgi:hypothetical protein